MSRADLGPRPGEEWARSQADVLVRKLLSRSPLSSREDSKRPTARLMGLLGVSFSSRPCETGAFPLVPPPL